MRRGFVVSAVLYPLLILGLSLMMIVLSMSDNRRKVLDNLKLEVSEESDTDPEMSNNSLYYKMQALEEAYAEMSSRLSEERLEEIQSEIKNQIKLESFPIGSIFTSTTNTNPAGYIGGTWESYGEGRELIGAGNNGVKNYKSGDDGGSDMHTHVADQTVLTIAQLAQHNHAISPLTGTTASAGVHNHYFSYNGGTYVSWPYSGTTGMYINFYLGNSAGVNITGIASAGAHTHAVTMEASTTGSLGEDEGHTHTITEEDSHSPYVVVYFWKRVG